MNYQIDRAHPSPNKSSRLGARIRMIVLHATVGSAASSLAWLTGTVSRVSSHYLLDKAGHIYQLVDDDDAAWHAGASAWMGLDSDDIQRASLGIELENMNTGRDPYPTVQIEACRWLCQQKIGQYEIERPYVVRHLDIAIPRTPPRKTDPAGFPWAVFVESLYVSQPPAPTPPIGHYRVKAAVTAGATIRSDARRSAAQLGRLRAGDRWAGSEVHGETVALAGFQASDVWVCQGGRCVWSGLLEQVI